MTPVMTQGFYILRLALWHLISLPLGHEKYIFKVVKYDMSLQRRKKPDLGF